MGMLKEFKDFAMRGNVVDMAVGIVIGGAFGKIVSSLVKDIIMPAVGMVTGGVDFSDQKYVISEAVKGAEGAVTTPEVAIYYGSFINTVIDFLIVAFAIFMVIRAMNQAKARFEKPEEEKSPAATPEDIQLLREIRDALAK
jgi:large conductance mechanosensitive channel